MFTKQYNYSICIIAPIIFAHSKTKIEYMLAFVRDINIAQEQTKTGAATGDLCCVR